MDRILQTHSLMTLIGAGDIDENAMTDGVDTNNNGSSSADVND